MFDSPLKARLLHEAETAALDAVKVGLSACSIS